jgi:hypothetical protein
MSIDKKILKEIKRHQNINNYVFEQEEVTDLPDEGGEDIAQTDDLEVDEVPEPVDVSDDPDVEVVSGDDEVDVTDEGGTEELDITDLVTTQKDISNKQDEYMDTMFGKLDDLTSKLGEMDSILDRINQLETKIEKYRQKSPEEKLQLRSLDSYPYNQKLTDFFMDKQEDLEKTGKNEYVLTSDDIESYSDGNIKKSFDQPFEDEGLM